MEDSNRDEFQSLEDNNTYSGHDDTSNVPLQYMEHTESTIKKETPSFYPGEIKQDDVDVDNTVIKDEPFDCDSFNFNQTNETNGLYVKSEPQDNSLVNVGTLMKNSIST